jgi:hypothetical protein
MTRAASVPEVADVNSLKDHSDSGRSCTDLDRRLGRKPHRAQRHQFDSHGLPLPVPVAGVRRYMLTGLRARGCGLHTCRPDTEHGWREDDFPACAAYVQTGKIVFG